MSDGHDPGDRGYNTADEALKIRAGQIAPSVEPKGGLC
jgi:hypothetical protein